KIVAGATGVSAFLGTNNQSMGIQISNASLGLVIFEKTVTKNGTFSTQTSYALDASGGAQLVGFTGTLTLGGNVGVRMNTTGGAVSETVKVNGLNKAITFTSAEGNFEEFT